MPENKSSLSSPLSTSILSLSFNQDGSCFAIGTSEGFKIFNAESGRLCYERECGALCLVEMLYSSSLLAIVGAGEQPSLSPRRLCLFNTVNGSTLRDLNFLTSVLAVRINKKRLIVVLRDKVYSYDSNSLSILDTIDTVSNPKGICAFSSSSDACYLALPASTSNGSVLLYNAMELRSHCQIDAHQSPVAALSLSVDGVYLATASDQGTIIRVRLVSQPTKSYSFRRGTYPSTITSLSFDQSKQAPDLLVATTLTGSVHVFSIGLVVNQRRVKRSISLLTTIIPDKISEALDPGHHFVLQNAVPAGVKSCATIHSIEETTAGSSLKLLITSRASVFIISHNGYFQEYSLSIQESGTSSWKLELTIFLKFCCNHLLFDIPFNGGSGRGSKARPGHIDAVGGLLAAAVIFTATNSTILGESETFGDVPQTLSGDVGRPARVQRPKSKRAESCTVKCVTTCIRGGAGSPGEGPLNARRPLVVFKQGFRSRQYCLIECSDICNLIKDGDDGI